ncbi:hypothetical protein KCU87_g415, partial [Aureobasidium melanogenum]
MQYNHVHLVSTNHQRQSSKGYSSFALCTSMSMFSFRSAIFFSVCSILMRLLSTSSPRLRLSSPSSECVCFNDSMRLLASSALAAAPCRRLLSAPRERRGVCLLVTLLRPPFSVRPVGLQSAGAAVKTVDLGLVCREICIEVAKGRLEGSWALLCVWTQLVGFLADIDGLCLLVLEGLLESALLRLDAVQLLGHLFLAFLELEQTGLELAVFLFLVTHGLLDILSVALHFLQHFFLLLIRAV